MKGIAVTGVATGQEALEQAEKTQFSIAILDVSLAGEDGLDLLRRFKKLHPDVPVVMFTAWGDDVEKRNEAMARGASGYFCKGESLPTLLNGVLKLMGTAPV
jgi:DNA-binding response OmpR family regulator